MEELGLLTGALNSITTWLNSPLVSTVICLVLTGAALIARDIAEWSYGRASLEYRIARDIIATFYTVALLISARSILTMIWETVWLSSTIVIIAVVWMLLRAIKTRSYFLLLASAAVGNGALYGIQGVSDFFIAFAVCDGIAMIIVFIILISDGSC